MVLASSHRSPVDQWSLASTALRRGQLGVTLIESLIALLVLSIALLGVGGLQLMTQRQEVDARWRSTAVTMSASLIEHLRADRIAAKGLALDGNQPQGCTGTNQWLCDLVAGWQETLAAQLPNATTQLRIDGEPDELMRAMVSISWRRSPESDTWTGECRPQDGADVPPIVDGGCVRVETAL